MFKNWLHFVGKSYYSIPEFIEEAKEFGIARAVSPQVLKKMDFGDRVLLAQKDGSSSKIFGFFVVRTITGLSESLIKRLLEKKCITPSVTEPLKNVQRKCGQYEVTTVCNIVNTKKMMETIREADNDEIGKALIGGDFRELESLRIPHDYVLTEIPFRKGFRLFDFSSFFEDVTKQLGKKKVNRRPKVKSQYYMKEEGKEPERRIRTLKPRFFQMRNYDLN